MTTAPLELTREQILAHRRKVAVLDERLPWGPDALHQAAWAGLTDSGPRAALLSIHARVEGARADAWEDPSLVQVWGPRFSAYVIAARDLAVFSLGRLSTNAAKRRRAEDLAGRLHAYLEGRRMRYGEAGHALGVNPNELRYAAPTGTVLIRWEGARQPFIWTVPPPAVDPAEARKELGRRFLHVFGPATPGGFEAWAGIRPPAGRELFEALGAEVSPVRTPIGESGILAVDEPAYRARSGRSAGVRLLPSGDTYFLLQGRDRELLVPDARLRSELWTPRVWPGAVLLDGEIVGTWRRALAEVTIVPWRPLSPAERAAIEEEAASLPLPDLSRPIRLRWNA